MTAENNSKKSGGPGGARPGAGRPRGSANRKTREIADKAAEIGVTPLEVMLEAMRNFHARRQWLRAAAVAKDAAPYMHPRLSSTELKGLPPPVTPPAIAMEPEALLALMKRLNEEY